MAESGGWMVEVTEAWQKLIYIVILGCAGFDSQNGMLLLRMGMPFHHFSIFPHGEGG